MANYNWFQSFMQKVASTRPGSWFYSKVLHHFDRVTLKLTNNWTTFSGFLSGLPIVMLTTTGAKSGLPRTIPLIAIPDTENAGSLAIIASNWGQKHYPAWYYNVKANSAVNGEVRGVSQAYDAQEVTGDEYTRLWEYAKQTYIGYPLYKKRAGGRHIPVILLTPLASQ